MARSQQVIAGDGFGQGHACVEGEAERFTRLKRYMQADYGNCSECITFLNYWWYERLHNTGARVGVIGVL